MSHLFSLFEPLTKFDLRRARNVIAQLKKESVMSVRRRSSSGAKFGVLTGLVSLAVVVLGFCSTAELAAPPTTPAAFFNYSSVIGLNKSITATHVPIQTSTGTIIYKDVTINFNVDGAGNLTYATTTPTATLSPILSSANIEAGIYTDAENTGYGVQVSGPAPIGSGGEAQWSIAAAASLGCIYPAPATFYTGPALASADSSLAARVKAAAITATQYSFGEMDTNGCGDDGNWNENALIGVTAVGSQLMVSSFTTGTGKDQSAPVETIIFNLMK
jgi:hypothetical protein